MRYLERKVAIKTRLILLPALALGLVATQAGAAEDLWTVSFDYSLGTLEVVSGDWSTNTPPSPTVINNGVAGSPSGNNMLDVVDHAGGPLPRIDRSIGTVVEGKTYRMRGYVYSVDPGNGLDVANIALLSGGSTAIAAWGIDDGALTYFVPGAPTPNMKPTGFVDSSWQKYELIYRSIAAAPDQMEAFIDGVPATIGGSPVGVLSPTNDLSTSVNNTLRIQGRDLVGFGALYFDDVSWTLLSPVSWTDRFDYNTGTLQSVSADWTFFSGESCQVISNGAAGAPSSNNVLDLPNSGDQARVDRDIGPVVEGIEYRARAYIFAQNPGPSFDVASIALMNADGTQVVGWGIDDGKVTLFVPGASTAVYKPSGLSTNTWQLYEVVYCPIAGAPDEMEMFIGGHSAETNGVPIGVISPTVELSTSAPNGFRIQGRDVSGFSALHMDDVSWGPPPPARGMVLTIE